MGTGGSNSAGRSDGCRVQGWRLLNVNESFVFPRLLVQKYICCNNRLFPILETKALILKADHSARVDNFMSCKAEQRGGQQTASSETKFSGVQNVGAEMGENKGSHSVQQGQLQAAHNGNSSSDVFIFLFSSLVKILSEPATLF